MSYLSAFENRKQSVRKERYVPIVSEFTLSDFTLFRVLAIFDEFVRDPIDEHRSLVSSRNTSGNSIVYRSSISLKYISSNNDSR